MTGPRLPRSTPSVLAASLLLGACLGTTSDPSLSALPPAASAPAPARVAVAFDIPRDGAPVDPARTPWPTEMARLPDGHIDLRAHPGHGSSLIEEYLARAAEDMTGFPVAPVVSFRFEGPIDLRAVPRQDTSRAASAPVALIDVDPASPEKGTLYPLAFHATTRDMRYVRAGTLAVRPLDGFVLRPGTLYAAVVRRSFGAHPGGLATAPGLDAVLSSAPRPDAAEERARLQHAPAVAALEALGVPRADIAALAVFRTGAPHALHQKLIATVDDLFATPATAPRILSAEWDLARGVPGLYRVVRGWLCAPGFQQRIEHAPFLEREGGRVLADRDGRPVVAPVPASAQAAHPDCPGGLRERFLLSVPEVPAPQDGFPLLVTAHGTGGDAESFLGRSDFAGWAATEGFAAISTDQPLHGGAEGGRPGASGPVVLPMGIKIPSNRLDASIAFYNPLYPGATLGNLRQAAADAAVLVRLFAGADLSTLPASKPSKTPAHKGSALPASKPGGPLPRLDARRTVLAGHSQGCQSLAALGAVDPRVRGVLLSGCGGDARLGILYGRPLDEPVAGWISLSLGLDPEELTPFHPLMALVQGLAEPIDPLAFARLYRDPPVDRPAPRVLHFEGLLDRYTPEVSAEALAVALRAQPVTGLLRPVPGLELLGLRPPVASSGSPLLSGSPASPDRLFAQFAPAPGHDGHFVLYDIPAASNLFRAFLGEIR